MALTATMRKFEIELTDTDRGVYETVEFRAAQHPSETERFLVARVLARCLEHDEAVTFSRGLSTDGEPAIQRPDLQGNNTLWVDIGLPAVDRLHKAAKTGARVVVYGWRGGAELMREAQALPIHRAAELEVYAFDLALLDGLGAVLDKLNRWAVAKSGGSLYVTVGNRLYEGAVTRL
jgi:uncharacterized protein YaeQ